MTQTGSLTWDDVERRIAGGALAILPIGAGAKQHGWHLPMASDLIQAEALATRLAARVDALVWPTLAYGHYPAFIDYPGSTSLSPRLFEDLVHEIATSLLEYGVRGLIVLDSGISTIAPIDRALARLDDPSRCLHLKIYDGLRFRAAEAQVATQAHGQHADEIETSLLLALAPATVALDRAEPGPARPPGPGPMQRHDPGAPNYSRSGVIGDPTRATPEKGEALLAAMMADLTQAVTAWNARTTR
jgi:creatinine amidohydrolase